MGKATTLRVPFQPISPSLPRIKRGMFPLDRGYLSNISEEEAERIRATDLIAAQYLRPIAGAKNLLNGERRWCLWIEDVDPETIRSSPELSERVEAVRKYRSQSKSRETNEWAHMPSMARQGSTSKRDYLAIPLSFDAKYEYLPVSRLSPETIANQTLGVIEDDEGYIAGILSSRLLHLWRKVVKEHFANDTITMRTLYNTLPMPELSEEQKEKIEHNFDRVLRTRGNFMSNNLAQLYSPEFKPSQLRQAHIRLNAAVYEVYNFSLETTEETICERLLSLYSQMSL